MTRDGAAARGWLSFRATFRLEIAEALRSRWFAAYAATFFALTGLLLVFGLTESRVLGFTGLSRTLVTYTQLAMAIAPVFVLISTVRALAGDREAGVFEYVLALPLSLAGWYAGRVFGRFALAIAPVAGALVAALVYGGIRGVAIPWREFLFDMGLLASLIFAFIGVGFLVSTLTRKVDTAQTFAFLIWLALLLGLDLVLLGALIRNHAPLETVVAAAMLNPLQVFRVASMMLFDPQLVLLGPTAYAIFDIFGRELFLVWAFLYPIALGALSAGLGYWALSRSDLP
ncbi:MAG: ABC transporter permease subunit [Rhizobiales bacterium]|nr:ABC transporter permease subunit [Hyphomicrobiales bacterium]